MDKKDKTIDSFKRYIQSQKNTLDDYYKMDEEYYKDQIEELELSIKLLKMVLNLTEKQQKELETYKKIADKLAFKVNELDISGSCHLLLPKDWDCKKYKNCEQCIIDWARKEVEKDE